MQTEIAVRAFIPIEDDEKSNASGRNRVILRPDFSRVLVFDTETTIDSFQNLKFGSFKVYEHGQLVFGGIFCDADRVNKNEFDTITNFCKLHSVELMLLRDFVDNVFLREVYGLETICIGFNLPFDLSRLAIDFGYSRQSMRGGFSFKLSENNSYPGLSIKHIDNSKAFIRFTSPVNIQKRKKGFKGHFLDLHTVVNALTGESHSLESACELFGAEIKKVQARQHGRITDEYIDYNLNDVDATYALYQKAKEEFDLYGLGELSITQVYSTASIGKACFKKMNIKPFHAKNAGHISNEVLGYVTTTYIGGRSEDKIRKQPMPVTVLDFLSMYPSMCILLNLWDFIICDHIEQQESTKEVIEFVETITIDDFQKKDAWGKLDAIVQVELDGDILLPIRAKFDNKHTYNIGDCHLTSVHHRKLWYTIADVVNSKIRTGKMPKIVRAIRFVPVGRQQGLRPMTLFGKIVDPRKDNFFKMVIEQRKHIQQQQELCNVKSEKAFLDKKQKALKLIANATSYGIFMEINTEEQEADMTVYGLETIHCHVNKVETFGKQNNPFVATFITSGARLVLGIVEALLARHGAVHAFCDTDSMAVPPQHAKEIQDFFSALNPYNFNAPLFKVENENVLFYGISAKRYVLYKMNSATGEIEIVKASSHGLGHLLSPFGRKKDSDKEWEKQVWQDIIHLYYGLISSEELTAKYGNAFALSKLAITKPHIIKRFDRLNASKPYDRQIKPFNFCIVGAGNQIDESTNEAIKPLSPYRKDVQMCPYEDFVDYNSAKILNGRNYWRKFVDDLWNYLNHPEAKFDGDIGILERKHVKVTSVCHIGKESNNLEIAEIIGVRDDEYVTYSNENEEILKHQTAIMTANPKDIKAFGIPRNELWYIKRCLASGNLKKLKAKTRQRLLSYVKSLEPSRSFPN